MQAINNLRLHVLDAYDAVLAALRPRRTAELAALRPRILERGFAWRRAWLARAGVRSLQDLNRAQLAELRAELS